MLKVASKEEAKLGKARAASFYYFFFPFYNFKRLPLRSSQNFVLTLALQARVRFVSDHKILFSQNKK